MQFLSKKVDKNLHQDNLRAKPGNNNSQHIIDPAFNSSLNFNTVYKFKGGYSAPFRISG